MAKVAGFLITLYLFCVKKANGEGVTCLDCRNEGSPDHCRNTVICGEGEICFTEEYKDNRGRQAFRLGCVNQARCHMFLNATSLVGRRDVPGPAPLDKCYRCCSKDECNAGLCLDTVEYQLTTSTPTRTTTRLSTSTNTNSISHSEVPVCNTDTRCPKMFYAFKNHCYFFSSNYDNRFNARRFCQYKGADLISVTSKEENEFLANSLEALGNYGAPGVWTGAKYSGANQQWIWEDGSPFNYTNWLPNFPPSSYDRGSYYYLLMGNPASSTAYKSGPMWMVMPPFDRGYGVVCKRLQL